MSKTEPTNLILEKLKRIEDRLVSVENLRGEIREGFASLRSHLSASHNDQTFLERRVMSVETDVERIKKRLDLVDNDQAE